MRRMEPSALAAGGRSPGLCEPELMRWRLVPKWSCGPPWVAGPLLPHVEW